MINSIPSSWKYTKDLENLLFFYQASVELLRDDTPDSYALPLHNTITLIYEMDEIFNLLNKFNIIDYYNKYIPIIIDEFIEKTTEDEIFKKILGMRLDSIRTGFREAQKNYKLFERWIGVVKQACSSEKYMTMCRTNIEELITKNENKKTELFCLIKNYYISLLFFGYSKKFIYRSTIKFFNNKNFDIYCINQIYKFFDIFDRKPKDFEFITSINSSSIEYAFNILNIIGSDINIEEVSEEEIQALCSNQCAQKFFLKYNDKNYNSKNDKKIIRHKEKNLDPYRAAEAFTQALTALQMFKIYFSHSYSSTKMYNFLHKLPDGNYEILYQPRKLQQRPSVHENLISRRISAIISSKSMRPTVSFSLLRAIEMHADAITLKNHDMIVRTLWTALETLFLVPNSHTKKENIIDNISAIIQKTYLLKITRNIYTQINSILCRDSQNLDKLNELNIENYQNFLEFFSFHKEDSTEMKKLYSLFEHSPLVRWKIFTLRKTLCNGQNILKYVEKHNQKIFWQLSRLYRIRNIITHIGHTPYGTSIATDHLHNYFDYIINYILCKSENGDRIENISTLIIEAQNDNRIHHEQLKSNEELSEKTYKKYFFGADDNLSNYEFS